GASGTEGAVPPRSRRGGRRARDRWKPRLQGPPPPARAAPARDPPGQPARGAPVPPASMRQGRAALARSRPPALSHAHPRPKTLSPSPPLAEKMGEEAQGPCQESRAPQDPESPGPLRRPSPWPSTLKRTAPPWWSPKAAAPSPGESWKRPKLTGSPSSRIPSPSKRCASWTSGRRSLLKFTTWWRRSWRSSTASPAEAQRTSRWPVPEQKRERPERALRPNGKTAQAAAPQARILPDKTHQHVHQLVDGRVAFGVLDRPRDAAPGVVFEKHQSHLVEGRLHRGDLDQ